MTLTLRNPKFPRLSEEEGDDSVDRLSKLPISIVNHIFSFLDTVDVVRTSAVSRKWRYMWVTVPSLSFSIFHNIWSDKRRTWSIHRVNDEFKDFINWVLISHSINIKSFHLCGYHNEVDDYTLYRWFNVVVRRNVQELTLFIFSETPIELPHCLVTCDSLTTLKFCFGTCSVLKIPTFAGFSNLKSLSLTDVELTDSVSLQNFIKSCPLLEDLSLQACVFRDLKILDISSASLKNLVIDNGSPDSNRDGLKNCELKVTCPSLTSLYFNSPLAKDFSFEGLNSLLNVAFIIESLTEHVTIEESHHVLYKIFQGLRNIIGLKLPVIFEKLCHQFLYVTLTHPECFRTSLCNLKFLKLIAQIDDWSMKLIVSLLNCFPNLVVLTICFVWCESDEWNMPDKDISCLTNNLKMVQLYEVNGEKNELELVRFLLQNGHALDKIGISWVRNVKNPGEITSEIMKFPKTSSNVALEFLQPVSSVDFSKL